MPATAPPKTIRVAIVGNPNTGKSTLFTALAGVRQRVGNYPGVTVEKKTGTLRQHGQTFELIDLPGTYSLAPHSPDEMVTVDVLLGRRDNAGPPDVVLSIVDASNLERNLFLVSQVLSLGLPTVVALNMVDLARERHIEFDLAALSQRLGVPVVAVQANRRIGIADLKTALADAPSTSTTARENPFPEAFQKYTTELAAWINSQSAKPLPAFLVERLLLDSDGYLEHELLNGAAAEGSQKLRAARESLAAAGLPVPAVEAMARYDWVARVLDGISQRPNDRQPTLSDRIDAVLTHKLWGTLIFIAAMVVLFSSIFILAVPIMNAIDGAVESLGDYVTTWMPDGALRSLLVDGIIGGVGAVVIFLPQILILFFFIALLEDCGYMARAAFLMDRIMAGVGLSGKSFIPLLSSFACAVPGIMATRVIENRRDRFATILIAPLMSCSARLPVYVILIGAFVPAQYYLGGIIGLQGLVLFAMYCVGAVVAIGVAWVLKRSLLRGHSPPFVMELPTYKFPSLRTVAFRMSERGWAFLARAGTVIFAVTIVIWALTYYPRSNDRVAADLASQRAHLRNDQAALAAFDTPENLDRLAASLHQRYSFLGRAGQWIEPAVRPLGWDWRIGCAAIASFPAREVVMGALGVIYDLGGKVDVHSEADQHRLQAQLRAARWDDTGLPVYNLPVALSIMVFFALCAQCAATLAVIRRETNSWRWPAFTFAYMTTLAYVGALVTYQVGIRILG
ncbi:MAG TPA: ferrous iron transport protein B [Lacipirellulaceae bacterium]|nr:ferrous iron transport protein B [Lacipirellulaceae bacterium]